jgi:hypothetical protein
MPWVCRLVHRVQVHGCLQFGLSARKELKRKVDRVIATV